MHPLEKIIASNIPEGIVSYLYEKLQKASSTYTGITTIWNIDVKDDVINWSLE